MVTCNVNGRLPLRSHPLAYPICISRKKSINAAQPSLPCLPPDASLEESLASLPALRAHMQGHANTFNVFTRGILSVLIMLSV